VLAALCGATDSVAVAGTHGKTTTSALLSLILVAAGRDPSCIVGGDVPDFGGGARIGGGAGLVLEADESDGTLDVLEPAHLVITNVDVDHLDYFGSFDEVQQSFVDAARRTRGFVVLNADDPMSEPVRSAMSGVDSVITFGCSATADVRLGEFVSTPTGSEFDLSFGGKSHRFVTLLRGVHNAMNCAAAVAMACLHGVSLAESAEAVRGFAGVGRRFTERGTRDDVTYIDDYAHLPAEIEAALDSARSHPSLTGRVVAVFQPNRFHRIAAMADSYAHCFERADCVVVTDVYASGTEPIDGVTGELVVDAIRSAHPDSTVVWARHRADVVREVLAYVRPGDLCISMGCGDIETFPDDVAAAVP
jgi:UDP-N-acetylmuramate--alanine ligase